MLSYDLSLGRVKEITHPTVGNHEYLTNDGTGCTTANAGAAGYFKILAKRLAPLMKVTIVSMWVLGTSSL
jgi:hypothetical protein